MPTECSQDLLEFGTVEGRSVVGAFDGGLISSDAGGCCWARRPGDRAERRLPPVPAMAAIPAASSTRRDAGRAARVRDRAGLRGPQRPRSVAPRSDHGGAGRQAEGEAQAMRAGGGQSTLNRLEHARRKARLPPAAITRSATTRAAIEALFVNVFLEAHAAPPAAHRARSRCHRRSPAWPPGGPLLPWLLRRLLLSAAYVFCGGHLLCAKLRRSNIDAAAGRTEEMARIVAQIRARWPKVSIVEGRRVCPRGPDGLGRAGRRATSCSVWPRTAASCPDRGQLAGAEREPTATGRPARRFKISCGRRRRAGGASAASSARPSGRTARPIRALSSPRSPRRVSPGLYEAFYCARGDMENRIKECQLDLYADRTSAATMRANQLRLWFASFAYVLMCALRRIGLKGTELARATCGTIRLKLLKIGALVTTSVRRVKVALASACPFRDVFAAASTRLR